jgi:glyoxylase-like metal-dependent hydrolase (beta-lactamase superfamily II)
VFNAFQENTYLLYDQTGECILVDAGCYSPEEKTAIDNFLLSNKVRLTKLINTHCHVDHVLGMAYLAEKYKPEIWAHQDDLKLLTEARKHGIIFGFDVEQPPVATGYLEEGKDIVFGNSRLQVFHVPGHSPGSVALYSREANFVIVGDVLFKGSIGRTDLPGGNYDQLMKSIFTKLMSLPPDTVVYSGHGPSTTIHEEALSNPFLA